MTHCRSCGAPLPAELSNGRHVCDYCQATAAPTLSGNPLEQVVDLGREAGMDCPVCHQGLHAALLDGSSIAWCPDCHGMLLDDMTFASTVQSRRSRFGRYGHDPIPLDQRALKRRLDCTRCRRAMQVHPYCGPGNVVIDSCYPCGLIWIDAGELAQIEKAPGRR